MRQRVFGFAFRILLVSICGFASWWSARLAWADWLADSGDPAALAHALRLEPDEARLHAMSAILRSDNGDASPAADRDLERALFLDPLDSTVLMTLGLRAEFRGDRAAAQRYLVRAAEVDHQFKPAWTLANFYARSHQPDKIWPLLRRCLELDPLGFDSAPVFDLCWTYTDDANKVLDLIPPKRGKLIEYLSYLIRTGRTDAAVQLWPRTLRVANAVEDATALMAYPGMLVKAGRIGEAVAGWNSLVSMGVVNSAKLDPAAGNSIGDPLFYLPRNEGIFSWRLQNNDGVFMRKLSPSLQIEFDGNELETLNLLQTFAPVIAGRRYRLTWKTDASRLGLPDDPGFRFRITQGAGEPDRVCPLLVPADGAGCDFTSAGQTVEISLTYSRAAGTIRSRGVLQLLKTSLELAP